MILCSRVLIQFLDSYAVAVHPILIDDGSFLGFISCYETSNVWLTEFIDDARCEREHLATSFASNLDQSFLRTSLNLLEAQPAILIEPLLNPAAEAQAISRIHRIGQHKSTLVHRFMWFQCLSMLMNSFRYSYKENHVSLSIPGFFRSSWNQLST
ncbi:hypothetical protein Scep_005470 [Stephania cephalantha]|uniref:Uncharacterized protein n=1 Tax=Stephania cephalantha TaxID=152367 RepID=A0AAP0KUM5_9MAGN